MKRRLLLLAMSAGMLASVTAQTPNFGTAKADNVQLYAQEDYKANLTSPSIAKVNYRIVDDGTYFWAHYTLVTENEEPAQFEVNAAWAAQLRNWGTDGASRAEMDLTVRSDDRTIAYSNREGKDDANYYAFTRKSGTVAGATVKMQSYAAITGNGYNVTDLYDYVVNGINNPSDDEIAPTSLSVSHSLNQTGDSVILTLNATDDSGELFYYIYDTENHIAHVSFTNSFKFAVLNSRTYNISILACDYDGNKTEPQTIVITTPRAPFDASKNLALGQNVTTGDGDGSILVDGNDGNGWQVALENSWFVLDLGTSYDLRELQIRWETAYADSFKIETSADGQVYSEPIIYSRKLDFAGNYEEVLPFVKANVRYIKLTNLRNAINYNPNIREFRVYGVNYTPENTNASVSEFKLFSNTTELIPGEAINVYIVPVNAEGGLVENTTYTVTGSTGITVTPDEDNYGYYTISATQNGTITATLDNINSTFEFTCTEAPQVASISLAIADNILDLEASNAFPVGYEIPLTVTCLDQYGQPITDELVWDATNASVANNKITLTTKGEAKVSASFNEITSNELTFNVVTDAENVALNKTVSAIEGSSDSDNAVDGDFGSVWVMNEPEGTTDHTYNAWLSVDLGDMYDIELIEVIWEGASSKEFTFEIAGNDETYEVVGSVTENPNMATVYNRLAVTGKQGRYVKINSTVAGTQYGTKIRELRVYGKVVGGTSTNAAINVISSNAYASGNTLFFMEYGNAEVYSVDGRLVYASTVDTNETIKLSEGIYVVRLNGVMQKIIIR